MQRNACRLFAEHEFAPRRGSRTALHAVACSLLAGCTLAACGGGQGQFANEQSGTFHVRVESASFPKRQHLAQPTRMRMIVRNTGRETVPNIAVIVDSFSETSQQPGLADPKRPVWLVNVGPRGGDTAYVHTWALGELPPGRTKIFVWQVTPVAAGQHTLHWRFAAGLNSKAQAVLAGNRPPEGRFIVNISRGPVQATLNPTTWQVVRSG